MKRIYTLIIFAILLTSLSLNAQDGWVLKKGKDNIKVYSRGNGKSKINELKVEMVLNANLSEIAAFILDIENYPKWSRNLKTSYILKQISDGELYFYTEVNSPWPANNRDLVVHLKILQDTISRTMSITAIGVPNFIPSKKDIVRVPYSNELWTVIPVNNTAVAITYYMQIDPGGSAPAWLVNLFAVSAPLDSFKYLDMLVHQTKYQHASIAFIKN
jgi:START domain